jgi:hypothetical protein
MDFGDGSAVEPSGEYLDAQHGYAVEGTYTVTATNIASGEVASMTLKAEADPPLISTSPVGAIISEGPITVTLMTDTPFVPGCKVGGYYITDKYVTVDFGAATFVDVDTLTFVFDPTNIPHGSGVEVWVIWPDGTTSLKDIINVSSG